ncbi:hypothetical protein AciX8_4644 [Granulicella mallensis MP5ACTX8]|uniref:Uncharacterized protein n=1 Tax=Granulicella mallensis (strain ATCC BAA-1857 / DSM 23137 / MP5ACTX8) TaxID=682795 RepID=G8NWM7_GRAMM|nr:hypothetical protein AciX8_4644 [Granulicella mallensis MP5ACTX8]
MSDEAPHQNRHSIEVYVWTSLTSTEPNRILEFFAAS